MFDVGIDEKIAKRFFKQFIIYNLQFIINVKSGKKILPVFLFS